jgi:chemotaxis-related protein WspB
MLFLVFNIGADHYALEAARVVEVVPLLEFSPIPLAPECVVGVFNYRSHPVPALDLCRLLLKQPAAERLSTRIIIVRLQMGGQETLLGLVAEQATGMIQRNPSDFKPTGVQFQHARFLGPVLLEPSGSIQWLREQELVTPELQQLLFADTIPSP